MAETDPAAAGKSGLAKEPETMSRTPFFNYLSRKDFPRNFIHSLKRERGHSGFPSRCRGLAFDSRCWLGRKYC